MSERRYKITVLDRVANREFTFDYSNLDVKGAPGKVLGITLTGYEDNSSLQESYDRINKALDNLKEAANSWSKRNKSALPKDKV